MIRTLSALLALALALMPAACGTVCDPAHQCAVELDSSDSGNFRLCDGTSFVACTDPQNTRRVACPGTTPRSAVCTPSGWTFQTNAQ